MKQTLPLNRWAPNVWVTVVLSTVNPDDPALTGGRYLSYGERAFTPNVGVIEDDTARRSRSNTVTIWHEENLLIDGKLVPAEGGKTYENISPFTEEVIGVAADATLSDVRAAIDAARRAFDTTDWTTNRELRLDCLRKFHAALVEKQDDLRQIVINEVGAPVEITKMAGLDTPIASIPYFVDVLEKYDFQEDLGLMEFMGGQHRRFLSKEPVGVVAAITAYNYPIQLALAKIIPALAAGCTVILKGAPQTPWCNLAIGHVAADIFPAGVLNVITSDSAEVAAELTTHKDVDSVTFTGSTPVGKKIMAAASGTVKRVFLELGGKSAMVMLEDGDINLSTAMACFATISHSGQGCAITSRLVVPRARVEEAAGVAKYMMENMVKVGNPAEEDTKMGPLITKAQQDKVKGYVDRAIAAGATVVTGGKIPENLEKGFFFEPTVLIVDENSEIAQEELFGPVLAIIAHDGDDDAVRIANNSEFGLSGGVSSADPEKGLAAAKKIRTGTIGVNGGMWFGADAPFGGFKQSGLGREMGVLGFEEFLEIKTIAIPEPAAS
jgi:acyl-CoA reductase-like NAD-dependent aldehyde dehydrogenase